MVLTVATHNLSGRVTGNQWTVDFFTLDTSPDRRNVTTQQELLDALADDGVEVIEISGALTLTQSVTLTKPTMLSGGELYLPEGAELTVSGTQLVVYGLLDCDSLVVEQGGTVELEQWTAPSGMATLTLRNGSWLYTWGVTGALDVGRVDLDGGSLAVLNAETSVPLQTASLAEDSALVLQGRRQELQSLTARVGEDCLLIQLCELALQTPQLTVDETGQYHQSRYLEVNGGLIQVEQQGRLLSSWPLMLNPDSTVENRGVFELYRNFDRFWLSHFNGQFDNQGSLCLSTPIMLEGALNNQGMIYSNCDPDELAIQVTGDGSFAGSTEIQNWTY